MICCGEQDKGSDGYVPRNQGQGLSSGSRHGENNLWLWKILMFAAESTDLPESLKLARSPNTKHALVLRDAISTIYGKVPWPRNSLGC